MDNAVGTERWRIPSVIEKLVKPEYDFTSYVLPERVRLLSRAAPEPMKTELQVRHLHHARSSHVVLFRDLLVRKCSR